MINDGTQAYTFDEANRLKTAGNYFYTYSGLENKRVIAYNANGSRPSATINLYGPDGKRLGYYGFSSTNGWTTTTAGSFQNFLYLGNKALSYTEDRTGSAGNYFPYGNGYNVTGAESQAFGTYVQDESGLLYADQRHYNPGFGRFMTADRSNANIDYGNPTSWNRYAYTNGDPVNGMDPTGQDDIGDDFSTVGTHAGSFVGDDTSGGYSGSSGSDGAPDYSVTVVALSSTAPTAALANAWNALSNAVTSVQNNPVAQLGAGAFLFLGGLMEGNSGALNEGFEEGSGALEQGAASLEQGVSNLESEVTSFFDGTDTSALTKLDPFHAFPASVEAFEGSGTVTNFVGGDGLPYTRLDIPGSYQGQEGVFEFIKDASGNITHRFFNPNQ